jgi:hypothetical protein
MHDRVRIRRAGIAAQHSDRDRIRNAELGGIAVGRIRFAASGSHRRWTMPSAVLHSIDAKSSGRTLGNRRARAVDVRMGHQPHA